VPCCTGNANPGSFLPENYYVILIDGKLKHNTPISCALQNNWLVNLRRTTCGMTEPRTGYVRYINIRQLHCRLLTNLLQQLRCERGFVKFCNLCCDLCNARQLGTPQNREWPSIPHLASFPAAALPAFDEKKLRGTEKGRKDKREEKWKGGKRWAREAKEMWACICLHCKQRSCELDTELHVADRKHAYIMVIQV